MNDQKIKVAVLGGGMGALASAWQLVQDAPDRFEITVYQRGSRLGGKGASGRNMTPGKGRRVEEHGLHILMGFYDNAFQVLKTCYDSLGDAVGRWEDALTGCDRLQIPDLYANGEYVPWELEFPSTSSELPGERSPTTLPDMLVLFGVALNRFLSLGIASVDVAAAIVFLEQVAQKLGENPDAPPSDVTAQAIVESIRLILSLIFSAVTDPEARDDVSVRRRRQAMAAYFTGANLIGIVRYQLWKREDYLRVASELDALDYKAWLREQCDPLDGGLPQLAWESQIVNALYDLVFSRCPGCPGGDPGFAAGTALYDCMLMLTYYWGHLFYRMNAGMGDIVFAPLYLYLQSRGVKFKFFNTVKELTVSSDLQINTVVVESQWDGNYQPLFECRGRPCWRQAEAGDPPPGQQEVAVRTLHKGVDFDLVVLGISVGALKDPALTGGLQQASAAFARMVAGLKTVQTQAVQLWFSCTAADLGWRGHQGMLGSFARPFDAWADMSQVVANEDWSSDGVDVKSVAYLCDVYSGSPAGALTQVHDLAATWLTVSAKQLWPQFAWSKLAGSAANGQSRLDDQYWRVNLDASDGYVLAAPGTSSVRLAPDESGFGNLFLAGDWTRTDLNAGCLEAAAMSGRTAARAILNQVVKGAPIAPIDYLEQDSDWVLRHPVHVENADATIFALPAGESIGAFCQDLVDSFSSGKYKAEPFGVLGVVPLFLMCANLEKVSSGDPEQAQLGYFSEKDVGFLIPVTVTRISDGQQSRGVLCPYLFVTSPIGLSAGREIFGLPKALASIRLRPDGDSGPFDLGVTGDVLPLNSDAPQKVQEAAIVGVSSAPDGGDLPNGVGAALLEAMKAWLFPNLEQEASLPTDFNLPLFLGKQIRDGVNPRAACYRSFMQCDLAISKLHGVGPVVGSFNVFLPAYAKPRIAAQLGLATQLRTSIGFQAGFDLVFPETQLLG